MSDVTAKLLNDIVTVCFVGSWLVLGISGFILFYFGRNAAFKRKWFPRYCVLGCVLFVLFSTTLWTLPSRSLEGLTILAIIVPMSSLICWLNIKFARFCDHCGAMILPQNWLVRSKFCPGCGSGLDPNPKVREDRLD